jgi:hypothetical protein
MIKEKSSVMKIAIFPIMLFIITIIVTVMLPKYMNNTHKTVVYYELLRNVSTLQLSNQEYDVFIDYTLIGVDHYLWSIINIERTDALWYIYSRNAIAEIDFSELNEQDVYMINDTLVVNLPCPSVRVTEVSENNELPRLFWFETVSIANRDSIDSTLAELARAELLRKVEVSSGSLISEAKTQARLFVERFFQNSYAGTVRVVFNDLDASGQQIRND